MRNDYKKEYEKILEEVKDIFNWWGSNNQLELIKQFAKKIGEIADEYESKIPFVSFGNEELSNMNDLSDDAICPNCGKLHKVRYGTTIKNGKKIINKIIAFVTCDQNNKDYLVGVAGKDVTSHFRKKVK